MDISRRAGEKGFAVRIIAGKFRRRRLRVPKEGTRPTMDRVKESLFSILGNLEGDRVVDLYAGTGALGLEAASRGAIAVTLVEANRHAAAVIQSNIDMLGAREICSVVQCSVERSRGPLSSRGPFDLILADPPWAISHEAIVVIPSLVEGLLAPGARLVVGHASKDTLVLAEGTGLSLDDCRRWGDSALSFLSRSE